MSMTKTNVLPVPGASLTYDMRGSGPLLLMISGGSGGSVNWNDFANYLSDTYTVVTYDRRAALRSPLTTSVKEISLETHSDDAHRLLAELTTEPVYVFASSAGALVALDLVAHHPEQVRMLVAHEPPAHYLLPVGTSPFSENPLDVYHRDGVMAARAWYYTQIGINPEIGLSGSETSEVSVAADSEVFFKYTLQAARRFRLDFLALQAASSCIILAGGHDGKAFVAYRAAAIIAEKLGKTIVECPGNHIGYIIYPQEFSQWLHEVLTSN